MDLIRFFFRPWTKRVARRVLVGRSRARGAPARGRFTHEDVDRLLTTAWVSYDERAPALPREPTAGSTMNVRLACFTLAFVDALLANKVERGYAIELVADAAWGIYSVWGRVAALRARIQPAKGSALGFATIGRDGDPSAVSLRFPFNAPGYVIKAVTSASGTAFDVVGCPVARYFRANAAADVCVAAWCNLDYPLGEVTHQRLVRTLTLVQGDDHCDFRVFPADASARAAPR